ncbi:hypothetical protein HK096_009452 [Nowakowskiella sp. JEL0078]|nr:hypothetical protein HK096_009452 [Nowakowskiella sp. JEL0078]
MKPKTQARSPSPVKSESVPSTLQAFEIFPRLWSSYLHNTQTLLKIIDAYLVVIMLTGIIQFIYVVIVGTFPYNAFLSGFICSVGSFVLTVWDKLKVNLYKAINVGNTTSISTTSSYTQAEQSDSTVLNSIIRNQSDSTKLNSTIRHQPTQLKKKYGPKVSPFKNPRISVADSKTLLILSAFVFRKNKKDDFTELLLQQRWVNPHKGKWDLPGDFIGHEDPADAVLRILKYQTNLAGKSHFLTIKGTLTDEREPHNVTFYFVVEVDSESLEAKNEKVIEMEQDGTIKYTQKYRSAIDQRTNPSWAWWYRVEELPNWLTDKERFDYEVKNESAKDYDLVEVAFEHSSIFPIVRSWLDNHKSYMMPSVEFNHQPVNRGNSALTTDIIVIRRRKGTKKFEIALIERGNFPFKGRKAFPGGFVEYKEEPTQGALRELMEETHLSGTENNIHLLGYKGSIERDPRQHTVTCVYVLKADEKSFENFSADDDAADARWYDLDDVFKWPDFGGKGFNENFNPLSVDLKERKFAFDHAIILQDFRKWWGKDGEKGGWFVEA